MSNHNYSQYSNNKKNNYKPVNKPVVEQKPVAEVEPEVIPVLDPVITPVINPVVETVETVTVPETVKGVVVNCAKLNVREKPNTDAEVVCVLNAQSEIEIVVAKSTNKWFYVCTATGVEGYCMRQYVEASL